MRGTGSSPAELLALAREAAQAAGAILREHLARPREAIATKSTPTDVVAAADLDAERAIRDLLADRRPHDAVLGEEHGERSPAAGQASELHWIVDPLDGTVNFLYGIPAFAVSIACEDAAGGIAGVVYDPIREESFEARRDGPATLNGDEISAPGRDSLADTIVATGFGYDPRRRELQARIAARVIPAARDVRRFGAAALDLAWVACGRLDAYYEHGLQPWDWAAGRIVCARAGVALREIAPAGGLPGGLVAAPPGVVEELVELVGASEPPGSG